MIKNIIDKNEQTAPNAGEMEVLHRYFPQCFTNEDRFDIDRFKTQIQESVNITHEGYDLNFLGRNYAKLLSSIDTTTVIVPDEEHNALPENAKSENIYISGDNLDGLKHLLKSYAGQVKCIYIDPPYNTGTDGFVYNDKFTFTAEELSAKLSISEEQAAKILDLTRRGSASHSAWLTFMACRLQLARDLLTEDGVIFISIDNNEFANLKILCDFTFGEENFIEMFSWVKTSTPPSLSTKSRKTNEYVLCYEKIKNEFKYKGELLDGGDQPLLNTGNAIRTLTFPKEKVFFSNSSMKNKEIKAYSSGKTELLNNIIVRNGYSNVDIQLKGEFKWTEEFLRKEIEDGTTFIIKSDLLSIRFIRQGEGWKRPTNFIKDKIITPIINKTDNDVDTNEGASSDLEVLMGSKVFSFPKPVSLIEYLINFVIERGDIVLDFFSGSGTTAEAVIKYNSTNETAKIKYILIQLPENLDKAIETADSQNRIILKNSIKLLNELGKPHTLDQIGQERIRRAAAKIKAETGADIDYGFKHYTLAEPDSNTLDKLEEFDPRAIFADETVLEKFGKSTVLETWLVRDGYGFGASVNEVKLDTYTAYHYDKHLYLVDVDFSEKDLAKLIDRYNADAAFCPENIVIFGYSFTFTQTEMLRKNTVVLRDGDKNLKINIDVRY